MVVRHVQGAGAQANVFGGICQGGNEQRRRCDVFFGVGRVLTDISFDKTQLIRQDKRLTILLQRQLPIFPNGMHGHGKKAEFHDVSFKDCFGIDNEA
jgi:hypothetical protein